MYIIYSNNLKTNEILSHGPQYVHRDDAISNLIKEVQNYLFIYKRIENHKIVEKMDKTKIDPDIVWYIEQIGNKITLYKVVKTFENGWFYNSQNIDIEKHMIFSVIDLPSRPVSISSERQENYTQQRPSIRNNELFSELLNAIKHRRDVMDESN